MIFLSTSEEKYSYQVLLIMATRILRAGIKILIFFGNNGLWKSGITFVLIQT
jgi:hypothetical protein